MPKGAARTLSDSLFMPTSCTSPGRHRTTSMCNRLIHGISTNGIKILSTCAPGLVQSIPNHGARTSGLHYQSVYICSSNINQRIVFALGELIRRKDRVFSLASAIWRLIEMPAASGYQKSDQTGARAERKLTNRLGPHRAPVFSYPSPV